MQGGRQLLEQRFVRVRERHDGFVEFDFSIGDPQLYVELILTESAFDEFCQANQVQMLNALAAAELDADKRTWREGETRGHN